MNYHYKKLKSKKEREAYKKIVSAVSHLENTVNIHSMSDNNSVTISGIISAIKYDHPEFFYFDYENISLWTKGDDFQVDIKYSEKKEVIMKKKCLYTGEALKIIRKELNLNQSDDDFHKIRLLHDYMVRNTGYWDDAKGNYEKFPEAFTIEGFFNSRRGVCSGLSKIFKFLCDLCNVQTFIVTGQTMQKGRNLGNHAWNIVCLDKKFYHCDITWDICMSQSCRHTRYDYFCISDHSISSDHELNNLEISCLYNDRNYFTRRKCILLTGSQQFEKAISDAISDHPGYVYFKIDSTTGNQKTIDEAYDQLYSILIKSEIYANKGFSTILYPNCEQGIIFCRISSA